MVAFVHTPGWTMEQTTAELRKLHAEGLCDVAVIDYLEKVAPSPRQLKMFGANVWQREADNVEQLKGVCGRAEIPVVMVAQMNKAGKGMSPDRMDRSDMTGSADKSNKANLVVLPSDRALTATGSRQHGTRPGGQKTRAGATGAFDQCTQPGVLQTDRHLPGAAMNLSRFIHPAVAHLPEAPAPAGVQRLSSRTTGARPQDQNCNSLTTCASNAAGQRHPATRSTCIT